MTCQWNNRFDTGQPHFPVLTHHIFCVKPALDQTYRVLASVYFLALMLPRSVNTLCLSFVLMPYLSILLYAT